MTSATILERRDNWEIGQLPDRRFPALAFKGDTFFNLVHSLRRAATADTGAGRSEGLTDAFGEMEGARLWFAETCDARGLALPL